MNGETFTPNLGVRRGRVTSLALLCVLALSLLSLIANVMWIERWPGSGMALFGVNRENSLASWGSSLLLAGLGVLTWLVYRQQDVGDRGDRLAWYGLASGFLFLSADESCMLHERLGGKIQLDGLMHHARWILLWLPAGALLAFLVLWRLWRSSRRLVLGLTLGIVVFVGGAAGVEAFNAGYRYNLEQQIQTPPLQIEDSQQAFAPIEWHRDRVFYPHMLGTAIEELLEMIAPVIWLWVLLDKRNLKSRPQTT